MKLVAVSGVRNRTHAVHVLSFVRSLVGDGGSVVLADLDGGPFVGSEGTTAEWARFVADCPTVETVRSLPNRSLDVYVAVGKVGLKPLSGIVRTLRRTPRRIVVTDEGLGSYGSIRSRFAALRRERPGRSLSVLSSVLGDLAAAGVHAVRWPAYRCSDSGWSVHEPVRAEFARYRSHDWVAGSKRSWVGYFTQPWPEVGVGSTAAHLGRAETLRERCAAFGHDLLIVPHPAEPSDRYADFHVLGSTKPAELEAGLSALRLAVGETSTALLNNAAWFGIPSARVAHGADGFCGAPLDDRQRSLMRHFVGDPVPFSALAARLGPLA